MVQNALTKLSPKAGGFRKKTLFIIIGVVVGVLLIAGIGIALYFSRPPAQRIADEIAFANKNKTCTYEQVLPKDANITDLRQEPLANFVALAKDVTNRSECTTFVYTAYATLTLDFKNYEKKKILEFTVNPENKATFDSYDWDSLNGQTVGKKMEGDKILTMIADDVGELNHLSLYYQKDKVNFDNK